jgi:hypothetical protein
MTTVFVCLAGFAGALVQTWTPVDVDNAIYLIAAAVLVAAANHMLIRSLRLGEISVVSPFRYSSIVWATILGVAIWGDVGVDKKCGEEFWREIAARMTPLLKNGRFTEAAVLAVQNVGEVLARHFPREPGDKNELPDDVSRG